MKKVFAVLILAILVAGGIYAQENWIGGQVGLLTVAAQYERTLTPEFSIGANVYWSSFFIVFNTVGVEAVGRYYFFPLGEGFFFGSLGVGFGHFYRVVDQVTGLLLEPGIGWKIDLGEPGGFYIEPAVSVPLVLGSRRDNVTGQKRFGIGPNVKLAFGMGYAF